MIEEMFQWLKRRFWLFQVESPRLYVCDFVDKFLREDLKWGSLRQRNKFLIHLAKTVATRLRFCGIAYFVAKQVLLNRFHIRSVLLRFWYFFRNIEELSNAVCQLADQATFKIWKWWSCAAFDSWSFT